MGDHDDLSCVSENDYDTRWLAADPLVYGIAMW
jgi:hypothetical protein